MFFIFYSVKLHWILSHMCVITNWIDMVSLCRRAVVSGEPSVDRQQHPLVTTVGGGCHTGHEASGKGLQHRRQVCSSFSYNYFRVLPEQSTPVFYNLLWYTGFIQAVLNRCTKKNPVSNLCHVVSFIQFLCWSFSRQAKRCSVCMNFLLSSSTVIALSCSISQRENSRV